MPTRQSPAPPFSMTKGSAPRLPSPKPSRSLPPRLPLSQPRHELTLTLTLSLTLSLALTLTLGLTLTLTLTLVRLEFKSRDFTEIATLDNHRFSRSFHA